MFDEWVASTPHLGRACEIVCIDQSRERPLATEFRPGTPLTLRRFSCNDRNARRNQTSAKRTSYLKGAVVKPHDCGRGWGGRCIGCVHCVGTSLGTSRCISHKDGDTCSCFRGEPLIRSEDHPQLMRAHSARVRRRRRTPNQLAVGRRPPSDAVIGGRGSMGRPPGGLEEGPIHGESGTLSLQWSWGWGWGLRATGMGMGWDRGDAHQRSVTVLIF